MKVEFMKGTVIFSDDYWGFFPFEVWLYQVFQDPRDHPALLDPKENLEHQDSWPLGHLDKMEFQEFLEVKETKENLEYQVKFSVVF